jgi:Nucleosome assembly protein (NAP)
LLIWWLTTAIVRRQWTLSKPLYEKRKQLAIRIPHFWPLVFEEAPPEIDHYIQPSDSAVFAECLVNVEVERFEIEREPRSFLLRFEFGTNKWFEDKILEKRFWYRRSKGNWQGLISEPVKIKWKKGHDLSNGITDASIALWTAFKASKNTSAHGFQKLKGGPEYKALAQKLENSDLGASSFFTLFSFISAFRYVDEKESQQAYEAEAERRQKRKQGERVEEPEDDSGLIEDDEIMVCPHGEDLAQVIADDLYPNAIKYFSKFVDIS